jgi:4-amino-4-deoxy-L-arabinose transferase-like glycosyltransferase/SAM-dependent methyltransferase
VTEIDQPRRSSPKNNDDFLWQQLKSGPAFRALLRAVEARLYQKINLPQPILDIGCGDGLFAQTAFDHPIQVGIDMLWQDLHYAENTGVYELPLQALATDLPFPDHSFGSAFSNSTLEHIPEIQPVLHEISRVLKPGAPLALTVPSHNFTAYLGGAQFLNRVGLESISNSYGNLFNRISQHAHTDPPNVWATRLAQAGFAIERWQYYFSENALRAFEKGHFGSIPSGIIHALTGHWILGPWESNLKWTEQWARPHYEEEFPAEGAYLFFLAHKKADTPIAAALPPANPFPTQELSTGQENAAADIVSHHTAAMAAGTVAAETMDQKADLMAGAGEEKSDFITDEETETADSVLESAREPTTPAVNWRPVITGVLVGLILLFAFWGQSDLRAASDEPGSGLGWIGLSALMLLLLVWYQRPRRHIERPAIRLLSLKNIPQRRWLYPFALLLSLIAPRFVIQEGAQRPGIAIFIWLVAIGTAFFALGKTPSTSRENDSQEGTKKSHFNLIASFLLFLAALLPRLFQLSSHPFILNGTEASIGLDVLNVIQGTSGNPFSTAWLTNPTLPLYLLAIPIKLLGPSTFAIRLVSPFVGAITVVALFLIAQRLYGRAPGLTAAILLLGSHFHVHFSRLGLTNAWDALLVLLSLGFLAIAWQKNPKQSRSTWLFAGLATGFSAYLYTSSHLLPLILLALLFITLIFEGNIWRLQWRNVIAMAALAFVIALPQLLHYQANPGLFMERANVMGILDSQSGWLSREAAQTGTSQSHLLTRQFWQAALAFNATLDTGTSYGPFVPLLNFAAGVLAVLGFFLTLLRIKQLRFSMLFAWISVTIIFGGALIENPPGSHRYIIAAPAVMIVAALALVELSRAIFGETENAGDEGKTTTNETQKKVILLIVPLIIAAAIALYDLNYYFGPYKLEHHFADRNTEIANDMANYLNSLDGDWTAYFFGPPSMYVGFSSIPFLVQDFHIESNLLDVLEPGAQMPESASPNLVFIFLPERYSEIEETKTKYPDGQERSFAGFYANPLFYVYEVPSSQK